MSTEPISAAAVAAADSPTGGVQSVHRVLDILEVAAAARGPLSLAEIAARAGLPAPTAHRLCRTLVDRGYLRQLDDRSYTLGFRVVPLAGAANDLVGEAARGVLQSLVTELGETANLAVLAGHQAEYIAQAPARYSMRMFTEVGRRVALHSTGVGKALLAQLGDDAVHAIVQSEGLPRRTPFTVADEPALHAQLAAIRREGFGMDEQEEELGVRCVAVPVGASTMPRMALSVSGPVSRLGDDVVERAVPLLRAAAHRLAAEIDGGMKA